FGLAAVMVGWSAFRTDDGLSGRLHSAPMSGQSHRLGVVHLAGSGGALGRLQIGLPSFDRDLDRRIGGVAPKFTPVENHRVEPPRVLALAVGDRVRKHVATPDVFDNAAMSAGIARQAGMARRIDVAGAHAVAWPESRRRRRRPVETAAG